MTMNCDEVQELLSPFADNMLEPGETKTVSEHLKTCSDCSQEYARLQALIGAIKSMKEEDLPEGFSARLHDRLVRETRSGAPRVSVRKRLFIPSWLPVGAIAAVLIVLLMGLSPAQLGSDGLYLDSTAPEQTSENDQVSNDSITEENSGINASEEKIEKTSESKSAKGNLKTGEAAQEKQKQSGSDESAAASDPSSDVRDTVTNGFRAEGARRENTENRGGEMMFKASGLVPFDNSDFGDEPASSLKSASVNRAQIAPFIHLRVNRLDNVSPKLLEIAKSLGGKVKAPVNPSLEKTGAAPTQSYIASIPCSSLKAFIDNLSDLGVVVAENLNTGFGSEQRCRNNVDELQNRKKVLTELLMHTSDTEKIRQLNQEIGEIDKEIAKIQSGFVSQPEFIEINVIVEEK